MTNPRRTLIDQLRLILPDTSAHELVDALEHAQAKRLRAWLADEGYGLDCVCGRCTACIYTDYANRIDPHHEDYQPWAMTN